MNIRHAARLTLACVIVCLFAATAVGKPTRTARGASQTFNLLDFGAVGDGQTDDGPALQAALDAIVVAGGGTLFVPSGRYVIATPVVAHIPGPGPGPSLEIIGVGPGNPIAGPNDGGQALSSGLGLVSEFAPRTGDDHVAILLWNFRSLLIKDLTFIGSADLATDARVTLVIGDIEEAVIQHCEFYGLMSQIPGGSIVQSMRTHLTIRETAFLGCTANSGVYAPVIQNWEWKGLTVEDSIFIDYGQRPELYSKTGYGSPLSWINIGDTLPPTPDSPRREVVLRRVFLDEGGWEGVTVQPARYQNPVVPLDLFYATGLYVNVSNFNTTGHYISGVQQLLIEDSTYTWSHFAESAIHIVDAQDAILDRIRTSGAATRLTAEYLTSRLTVIDSIYEDLASDATQTLVLTPATPDDDPVRYVRAQFESALGRAPDPAAHYYWSRKILDCGTNAPCVTAERATLAAYLATTPAPTFTLDGRATDEDGQPLAGVNVTLTGTHSTATLSILTGADGTYSFKRLPTSGVYTITASKNHYIFASSTHTVVTPAGAQVLDFGATLNRHAIGGRLLDEHGRAIQGATLTLSGTQTATANSDANGNYSFDELAAGGNYTVTVSSTRYSFASPSQTFTDLDANQTADFNGLSLFYSVNGQVVDTANTPVAGLVITLSGGKSGTATTDPQGNFVFVDLPRDGSYTVTPAKLLGSLFTPASKVFDNLTNDQTTVFTAVPTNYKIAGRVTTDGNGLAGVTVSLAGSKQSTTTTDSGGAYSFNVPVHGDYTVAPSKTHYTFDHANATFNGVTADNTADFVATLNRHKLSGSVKRPSGDAMAGVTVTLSGGQSATTTTDSQGSYSFANLPAGAAYIVTPSNSGFDFAPASKSFPDLGADQTADFSATPSNNVLPLTGRVTTGGAPLADVTVTLSGAKTGTTMTDSGGNYSFNITSEGSYTVTTSKTHYTFAPPSLTIDNPTSAQTANFEATLNRHKLTGRVVDNNNAGLGGVTVALTGSLTVTAVTDAQGNYSLTNLLASGNYTVAVSKANYTFSPASVPVNDLGADQTINFTATLNDYNIAGRVTTGAVGLAGVTITLSGSKTGTVLTDAAGAYSFNVPAEGNYIITPALNNYTFAPASATFANLDGNKTANFVSTFNQHTLSGRITEKGAPLAGITVDLTGTHPTLGAQTGKATTSADGTYSFMVPTGGDYTIKPSKKNYVFDRAAATFNALASDQTADFAATLQTVLSFTATSYTVAEGGGSITITVTREGDTTTGTSAVYEGHGDTARQGSDFVASIGLVIFAPGETSKTFTLFITDDAFVEGPELFTLTLTPSVGAVTGDAAVASVTISDNDATNSPTNPIDDDEFFVREQYRDFFSREPDAAGLKFWMDEIKKCGTNAQCREARRVSVSAAFFLSIEFKETGLFVYRLYRASFGRVPVRVGEFMLDSRVVGDDVVVGAEGWAERLAANKKAFLEEWTARPEFVQHFAGLDDQSFLQTLFVNMNVTLTDTRREALLAELRAGTSRADVLAEVIDDEQFNKQEFNRAFVLMQYFGYLRRNPYEAPDSDLTGYNHWLGKLDDNGGDYEKAEMVKAFLSSIEYRGRFGN